MKQGLRAPIFVLTIFVTMCGPRGRASSSEQPYSGMLTFDNKSGTEAVVKLVGATVWTLQIRDGQSRIVNLPAGGYYFLVRYGSKSDEYVYTAPGGFTMGRTDVHGLGWMSPSPLLPLEQINLGKIAHDDPVARRGFEGLPASRTLEEAEPPNFQLARRFMDQTGPVRVALSPDGRLLAISGSPAQPIQIWDVPDGSEPRLAHYAGEQINSLAFSPDGRWLAASLPYGEVAVWQSMPDRSVHKFRLLPGQTGDDSYDSSSYRQAVAFSSDGRWLAARGGHCISIWEVPSWHQLRVLRVYGNPLDSVTFRPASSWLAAASRNVVNVWDVATGRRVTSFEGDDVVFTSDGRCLVSHPPDPRGVRPTVKTWDFASEREIGEVPIVPPVAFSADPSWAVSVNWLGHNSPLGDDYSTCASVRAAKSGLEARRLNCQHGSISSLAFSSDGRWFVTAETPINNQRPDVYLWRVSYPTVEGLKTEIESPGAVASQRPVGSASEVARGALPGGGKVPETPYPNTVTVENRSSKDAVVKLTGPSVQFLTVKSGKTEVARLGPGEYSFVVRYGENSSDFSYSRGIAFSVTQPSGKHSAVRIALPEPKPEHTSLDLRREFEGFAIPSEQFRLPVPAPFIEASHLIVRDEFHNERPVAFSPDGKWVAFAWEHESEAGGDTALRELEPGACTLFLYSYKAPTSALRLGTWNDAGCLDARFGVGDIKFSRDNTKLASCTPGYGRYGAVRIWDFATRQELGKVGTGGGYMEEFLAGHTCALSPDLKWAATGTGRLYELATGRSTGVLAGGPEGVRRLAFSPDSRLVAFGTDTVSVIELPTGSQRTLVDSAGKVGALTFSPDGRWLASARGREVTIWSVVSGEIHREMRGLPRPNERYAYVGPEAETNEAHEKESSDGVTFSPDGRWLVSLGSYFLNTRPTLRLWDVTTWLEMQALFLDYCGPSSVAFSPDGSYIVTGGQTCGRLRRGLEAWAFHFPAQDGR